MLLEICQLLFSKKVIFVEISLIIELTERKYINVVKKINGKLIDIKYNLMYNLN